jgi:hypothetical protein
MLAVGNLGNMRAVELASPTALYSQGAEEEAEFKRIEGSLNGKLEELLERINSNTLVKDEI